MPIGDEVLMLMDEETKSGAFLKGYFYKLHVVHGSEDFKVALDSFTRKDRRIIWKDPKTGLNRDYPESSVSIDVLSSTRGAQ